MFKRKKGGLATWEVGCLGRGGGSRESERRGHRQPWVEEDDGVRELWRIGDGPAKSVSTVGDSGGRLGNEVAAMDRRRSAAW